MRSRKMIGLMLGCVLATTASAGQAVAEAARPIRDEAPIVVTGALPGPGMWKVSRNGHVMHVLGTVSPLPKRMEWISRDVERVLAQSGEVVFGPSYVVDTDLGFFGKLSLLPSLIGVRKNPDGKLLRDMVSPESYARWLVLKQRYIGRDVLSATLLIARDGIALALGNFGPAFPRGLFVAQDGVNAPAAQNFKLVSWADVAATLNLQR